MYFRRNRAIIIVNVKNILVYFFAFKTLFNIVGEQSHSSPYRHYKHLTPSPIPVAEPNPEVQPHTAEPVHQPDMHGT